MDSYVLNDLRMLGPLTADKQTDHDKILAKVIAVLPIENKAHDDKTSQLFRLRLLEELYFKGYSKIPLETIDQKAGVFKCQ